MVKKLLLSCVAILLLLTGCSSSDKKQEKKTGRYLSFNVTHVDEDEKLMNDVYRYNCDTKKVEKMAELESTSQYALATYSYADDSVYYSDRAVAKHQDNLYRYDRKSKEHKQLTDSLYALNDIIPDDGKIYLAAIPSDSQNFVLHLYEYKDGKLTADVPDDDYNVWNMSLNPKNGQLLLGGYSQAKEEEITEKNNESDSILDTLDPPSSTIYLRKGTSWTKKVDTASGRIDSLCFTDNENILYTQNSHLYENGSSETSSLDNYNDLKIASLIYKEGGDLYYADDHGINLYHAETKKTERIFHIDDDKSNVGNVYMLRK